LIYIGGDGWIGTRDEGVIRGPVVVSWESKGRVHQHQKPVWIAEHFIRKLPRAETILDPFMGSASTGVAAVRLGRKFLGIELDPSYFAISVKRIKSELAQGRLFDAEPEPKPQQLDIFGGGQ
jgi:site-specific DNA-methyltransferase (adenine-specific)